MRTLTVAAQASAKVYALDDADELGVCGVARHLIAFHEVP